MSLVVNHNLMAANTARNLNAHYSNLATSTQRLSTGMRINSAADDAAGLAIRELQRADIAALQQGARNANDAISLIQTADGALGIIDEKLIRMKELAEQAATGTYDSTQRLMIESEYQQMASEITRIANATDFNGMKLLDGTLSADEHDGSGLDATGKMKIHFGTGNDSAEDYYYIQIGEATAQAFGIGDASTWADASKRIQTQFEVSLKKQLKDLEANSDLTSDQIEDIKTAAKKWSEEFADKLAKNSTFSNDDELKALYDTFKDDDNVKALSSLFDQARDNGIDSLDYREVQKLEYALGHAAMNKPELFTFSSSYLANADKAAEAAVAARKAIAYIDPEAGDTSGIIEAAKAANTVIGIPQDTTANPATPATGAKNAAGFANTAIGSSVSIDDDTEESEQGMSLLDATKIMKNVIIGDPSDTSDNNPAFLSALKHIDPLNNTRTRTGYTIAYTDSGDLKSISNGNYTVTFNAGVTTANIDTSDSLHTWSQIASVVVNNGPDDVDADGHQFIRRFSFDDSGNIVRVTNQDNSQNLVDGTSNPTYGQIVTDVTFKDSTSVDSFLEKGQARIASSTVVPEAGYKYTFVFDPNSDRINSMTDNKGNAITFRGTNDEYVSTSNGDYTTSLNSFAISADHSKMASFTDADGNTFTFDSGFDSGNVTNITTGDGYTLSGMGWNISAYNTTDNVDSFYSTFSGSMSDSQGNVFIFEPDTYNPDFINTIITNTGFTYEAQWTDDGSHVINSLTTQTFSNNGEQPLTITFTDGKAAFVTFNNGSSDGIPDQQVVQKMLDAVWADASAKAETLNYAGFSVATQEDAQTALDALNNAVVEKDKIRAHIGALQNRFENTITNLNVQAENLQAAESRISDVDVSTEMTEFVRNQILTQSAVAMLAQANSLPQMAMQLIGG